MPCASTHKVSSTVQGAGPCCAAFQAYRDGHPGWAPLAGQAVRITDSRGNCRICQLTPGKGKNAGRLVIKRGKNAVPAWGVDGQVQACPPGGGCCALLS